MNGKFLNYVDGLKLARRVLAVLFASMLLLFLTLCQKGVRQSS